ncbi:MAG TPA: superoxide dismutase, Ni [Dehalococcoidia bacterium]|nr:superoxide dismutase, Ni [Dehalococcoidia bacterium]
MSRQIITSLVSRGLRTVDHLAPPAVAHAHCDIPCGIYDPHHAQIAALSVLRMDQLIEALGELPSGASKADADKWHNSFARYVLVKEEHGELCKREIRVIWGDYFKPEHAEKYPELNTLVWNILKLAGKNRQEVNKPAAEELLGQVQRFAEIFWETKGVQSKRQPSNQAVGGELVVPA